MRKKISQRQARRSEKNYRELYRKHEQMVNRWAQDYPGGAQIDTLSVNNAEACIVETATKCGCVCIVKNGDGDKLKVYAVRP